ncbi:MAG: CPBP family intramembrane glutamic endopeptidase [Rhodanobacteraceae bacterium]
MATILAIGLVVSLGGPLLLTLAAKQFSFNSLSLLNRLSFWVLAIAVLVITAYGGGAWLLRMGVRPFEWVDCLGTIVAIIAMLAGMIILPQLVAKLGFKGTTGSEFQKKVYSLSVPYRLFVVITAAVTEEILYRGYAIGIGQGVWNSLAAAFVVSLLVFVGAHFAHGAKALVTVFWVSLVMSFLFVATNNLFTCIIAHFVVDAFGVLFVPWIAARQRTQGISSAKEG